MVRLLCGNGGSQQRHVSRRYKNPKRVGGGEVSFQWWALSTLWDNWPWSWPALFDSASSDHFAVLERRS